ncbi:hypothetical protein IAE22_27830 [Bacillus sp. S34]|nr:hypothetical protein [Bacillus sp. S34]
MGNGRSGSRPGRSTRSATVTAQADTDLDRIVLDLHGTPDSARVNTVSGSVSVRLEDGVPYQCTVSTASGKLQFDDSEIRGVRGSYVKQGGELSGQWLDLRVNGELRQSGDLAWLAAAPAPSGDAAVGGGAGHGDAATSETQTGTDRA